MDSQADQFLAEHLRLDLELDPSDSTSTSVSEYASNTLQDDELYLERLETLYAKHLGEIGAFAKRESRSYEDVQRSIAQWYAKTLFGLSSLPPMQYVQNPHDRLSATMRAVSDALESLEIVAGYHSFFLTVNPADETDQGFLGGTILGREFWRGHRGCGAAGAQAFKLFCRKASIPPHTAMEGWGQAQMAATQTNRGETLPTTAPKKETAISIKAEVYASVRNAIRTTTGQRHAEMKWSNHEKLDVYGVRLEGWPAGVPKQNPSSLSFSQNKAILEALESGKMKFVSTKSMSNSTEVDSSATASSGDDSTSDTITRMSQGNQEIFADAVDIVTESKVAGNDTEENIARLYKMLSASAELVVGFHPARHEHMHMEVLAEQYQPDTTSAASYSQSSTAVGPGVQVDSQYEARSENIATSSRTEIHDQETDADTRKKRRRVESVAA